MLVAIARPAAVVTLPSQHETIILAMDVSGSMRAVDVQPNRLTAAQEAARAFINDQPHNVRIGVVSFAGTAAVVQPPTENREDLLAAIDRFPLQRGTAIGSGILVSLKTIFPDVEFDLGRSNPRPRRDKRRGTSIDRRRRDTGRRQRDKPVPPGSYQSAAIILLTDGQTTAGPDPFEAAKMAADRGVRVYTVGIGTRGGRDHRRGRLVDARAPRRGRAEDHRQRHASRIFLCRHGDRSAEDLPGVDRAHRVREKGRRRSPRSFAAAAAVFALLAAGLSLLWFNRIL